MANNQLPLEKVDDLGVQRMQSNISRKFNQDKKSGDGFKGCLGGTQTSLGNNSYKISHSLGDTPKGFVIISQSVSGSIKATMINPTASEVTITFDSSPGTFQIFLS